MPHQPLPTSNSKSHFPKTLPVFRTLPGIFSPPRQQYAHSHGKVDDERVLRVALDRIDALDDLLPVLDIVVPADAIGVRLLVLDVGLVFALGGRVLSHGSLGGAGRARLLWRRGSRRRRLRGASALLHGRVVPLRLGLGVLGEVRVDQLLSMLAAG